MILLNQFVRFIFSLLLLWVKSWCNVGYISISAAGHKVIDYR